MQMQQQQQQQQLVQELAQRQCGHRQLLKRLFVV
jgi:hypothetical protein